MPDGGEDRGGGGGHAFAGMSPDAIFHHLVRAGEQWADQDAAARLYEDLGKSLLAQLTLKRMNGDARSRALAEQQALSSDEWQKHVRASIAARQQANKLKVRYEQGKVWVELKRSINANQRAEMRMGGIVA